jgi:hypothetical protein
VEDLPLPEYAKSWIRLQPLFMTTFLYRLKLKMNVPIEMFIIIDSL